MLIERYLDRLDFREMVTTLARGLGLEILGEVRSGYGMVLAPHQPSPFSMRFSDYRPAGRLSEENRLLHGLIHIAIAATVYPKATDLLAEATLARNPVTVDEIETTLRGIVKRMDEAARGQPDPPADGAEGLYEAWRVYKHRQAVKERKDKRAAPYTTRRMIAYALEYLCKQHLFKQSGDLYRPLWRYQVVVQEYAASRVYGAVQRLLKPEEVG